jgi:hypothetical protein
MVVALVLVVTPATEAGDNDEPVGSIDAETNAPVDDVATKRLEDIDDGVISPAIEPWIDVHMPPRVKEKLRAALDLAGQRIREVPECAGLFTELGADGIEILQTTYYFPVLTYKRGLLSCRRAVAFTYVGEAPTFLCNGFSGLADERAAMIVVHEALHHAGLTEKPQDPKGMTSREINGMVRKGCGF